jgi:hypothetical protein
MSGHEHACALVATASGAVRSLHGLPVAARRTADFRYGSAFTGSLDNLHKPSVALSLGLCANRELTATPL